MRLPYLLALATLLLYGCTGYAIGCSSHCKQNVPAGQPESCPVAGHADGTPEGKCNDWPSPACASGATCIDGTCIACGGDGQVCCELPGPEHCNVGTCNHGNSEWPMCTTTCGATGQACCGANSCSSGICDADTHQCIAPQSNPCSGPNVYTVWFVDAYGCGIQPFTFNSSSDSDATACANAYLADRGLSGTYSLGPLNQNPTEYDMCRACNFEGIDAVQIWAFSTSALASCEQELGASCTWNTAGMGNTCP